MKIRFSGRLKAGYFRLRLGLRLRKVRERESPRVSGQPTPQDAVDRMGGGRSEGAKVNVNVKVNGGS